MHTHIKSKSALLLVAFFPSSNPASARIDDPVQMEPMVPACARRKSSIGLLNACSKVPKPPGTSVMCSAVVSRRDPKVRSVRKATPAVVSTVSLGPTSSISTSSKFESDASFSRTESGPIRSRISQPGNSTPGFRESVRWVCEPLGSLTRDCEFRHCDAPDRCLTGSVFGRRKPWESGVARKYGILPL